MQMQVETAVRDLEEALMGLHEQDVVARPLLFEMAQAAGDCAATRLSLIEQPLTDDGSDAREIG